MNVSELLDFLGCSDIKDSVASLYLQAAEASFAKDTGWKPFVAENMLQTLLVKSYLIPLPVPVYDIYSVTAFVQFGCSGQILSAGEYELLNKQANGGWLTMNTSFWACSNYVMEVSGNFGYCLEYPSDVKLAILQKAASNYYMAGMSQVKREKAGTVEIEYFDNSSLAKSYLEGYNATVKTYRRVSL